ncbi:hypothetical protein Cni_G17426 [Canna indica]|uniref:Uncharacterized protein n=1 Tax=Canna indica TaxID=4628 RepID=A0AAQ3KH30_9LILI|nr:hypothetical protein Cni_G17426 [Canna indica]
MLLSARRHNSLLSWFQLSRFRYLSSSTSSFAVDVVAGGIPSPDSHFIVEYLMKSCGLSAAEAAKASKSLAHLPSAKNPDAVLTFMRSQGFNAAHLREIICFQPKYLCWNVEKNLSPKLQTLREFGFSQYEVVDIVHSSPSILSLSIHGRLVPRLKMWESLFGSRHFILKHFRSKKRFFYFNIERVLRPNLKFLRDECGISEERILVVLRVNPDLLSLKPDTLRALVVRADELGVPRKTGKFIWSLSALRMVSKEKVEAQRKFMKSLGWSDSELSSLFSKSPTLLGLSKELLRRKTKYFVEEVGYTLSSLAQNPTLLALSLEKRVIPRLRVMEMLRSKGLWTQEGMPILYFYLSNTKFMNMFVHRYKEVIPELLDIFSEFELGEKGNDASHLDCEN